MPTEAATAEAEAEAEGESSILTAVQRGFQRVEKSVKSGVVSVLDGLTEQKQEYKKYFEEAMRVKVTEKAMDVIDMIPRFLKKQLKDPDMPTCIWKSLAKSIDTIWPDIRLELVWEIQVMINGDAEKYDKCLEEGYKPDCIRAFLRYHLFPYNKGVWYCLRDPLFVIVNILCFIPYMGIYAYMYLFIWLIIDKTDEYQLVYFILSFKGAQFFSWGVVKGLVGFTMYFFCTTFPEISLDVLTSNAGQVVTARAHSSCETSGPGTSEQYWVLIVSWLLPLVLVWVSIFLMPFSKEKGRMKLLENEAETTGEEVPEDPSVKNAIKAQGGYLRRMLIIDFVIFCLCVGLMALIIALQEDQGNSDTSKWEKFYNAQAGDWQVQQTFFFCQFLYGIFSIIFIPFMIPFLQAVLTHAAPTAYNENGQCCRFVGAEKPTDEAMDEEERKMKAEKAAAISDQEADGIMSNLANIANGKPWTVENLKKRVTGKKAETAAEPPTAESA